MTVLSQEMTNMAYSCRFRPDSLWNLAIWTNSLIYLFIPADSGLIPVDSGLIPVDSCGILWNPVIPAGICGAVRSTDRNRGVSVFTEVRDDGMVYGQGDGMGMDWGRTKDGQGDGVRTG